jgi:hypothetical protein
MEGATVGYTNCKEEGVKQRLCLVTAGLRPLGLAKWARFCFGFIERLVIGDENFSFQSGRNAWGFLAFLQNLMKIITVVILICDKDFNAWHSFNHHTSADVII